MRLLRAAAMPAAAATARVAVSVAFADADPASRRGEPPSCPTWRREMRAAPTLRRCRRGARGRATQRAGPPGGVFRRTPSSGKRARGGGNGGATRRGHCVHHASHRFTGTEQRSLQRSSGRLARQARSAVSLGALRCRMHAGAGAAAAAREIRPPQPNRRSPGRGTYTAKPTPSLGRVYTAACLSSSETRRWMCDARARRCLPH
mmetsp:Transcript_17812/g.53387  ORF Transcript_17812/g.53387 Transcript_17812/m.53387 type:complete len:204 (+) Transcript_17812:660-1271(+)